MCCLRNITSLPSCESTRLQSLYHIWIRLSDLNISLKAHAVKHGKVYTTIPALLVLLFLKSSLSFFVLQVLFSSVEHMNQKTFVVLLMLQNLLIHKSIHFGVSSESKLSVAIFKISFINWSPLPDWYCWIKCFGMLFSGSQEFSEAGQPSHVGQFIDNNVKIFMSRCDISMIYQPI